MARQLELRQERYAGSVIPHECTDPDRHCHVCHTEAWLWKLETLWKLEQSRDTATSIAVRTVIDNRIADLRRKVDSNRCLCGATECQP